MSYYKSLQMVRARIRNKWLPAIMRGATISVSMILYDLDNTQLEYSEKSVLKYLARMCEIEEISYDGVTLKK